MKIRQSAEGLLLVDLSISHRGYTYSIHDVVIDTGAVQSLISIDAVGAMFRTYEPRDRLQFMRGIGGVEPTIRRCIDCVRLGDYKVTGMELDFGSLHDHGINGLIGLDLLMNGQFLIDLIRLELRVNADSLSS